VRYLERFCKHIKHLVAKEQNTRGKRGSCWRVKNAGRIQQLLKSKQCSESAAVSQGQKMLKGWQLPINRKCSKGIIVIREQNMLGRHGDYQSAKVLKGRGCQKTKMLRGSYGCHRAKILYQILFT